MDKIPITKEILQKLYWDDGHKISDIANELGYSPANIRHWMVKLGVERRKKAHHLRREIPLTKEILQDLYWKQNMSLADIAEKFNCSVELIFMRMKEFGIERREEYKKGLEISKEELNNLYWNKSLSLSQIGEKFGCDGGNVLHWMKKYDIERRPDDYREIKISKDELSDLYINKRLSTLKIAEMFDTNHRVIGKKLKKHGIRTRTITEANTVKFKADFSDNLSEKAYLLGLRTGDFHAKKIRLCVRMQTTTTHLAQIELLRNSLEKYGETKVYLSKNMARDDEWFVYADLNSTFDFLLNKPEAIPSWILDNEGYFYQFLCAYSDCEATFNLIKSHENGVRFIFRVRSQDKEVLDQMKIKLETLDYSPCMYLSAEKGEAKGYGHYSKDLYELVLYRKNEVLRLIESILPLSKHSEKIRKMTLILESKESDWDVILPKLNELRAEIREELLKNLPKETTAKIPELLLPST